VDEGKITDNIIFNQQLTIHGNPQKTRGCPNNSVDYFLSNPIFRGYAISYFLRSLSLYLFEKIKINNDKRAKRRKTHPHTKCRNCGI